MMCLGYINFRVYSSWEIWASSCHVRAVVAHNLVEPRAILRRDFLHKLGSLNWEKTRNLLNGIQGGTCLYHLYMWHRCGFNVNLSFVCLWLVINKYTLDDIPCTWRRSFNMKKSNEQNMLWDQVCPHASHWSLKCRYELTKHQKGKNEVSFSFQLKLFLHSSYCEQ